MSIQLCATFEVLGSTQNGFPAKTVLNFKRAWQANFLSHAHQTQEICCFSADVRIILLSFLKLSTLEYLINVGATFIREVRVDNLKNDSNMIRTSAEKQQIF